MRLVRVVFLVGVPCQPHVEDDQGHDDQDCILLAMSNQANSELEHCIERWLNEQRRRIIEEENI